ncbi:MAG: hypothetical protein ABSA45_05655 [Verrucomicrobiota bacterium]|jgi:hypothetical protein
MKSGALKPSQNEKPALPASRPTKIPDKNPAGLPIDRLLDAWLACPLRQPDDLLLILRNRSN